MKDSTLHAVLETRLRKVPPSDTAALNRQLDTFFCIGEKLGYRFTPGDRILDFGCGLGDTVALLLDRGADALGIDVMELWGSEHASYWKQSEPPPKRVVERLRKVDSADYVIPFEGDSLDFCISSQVFEHVFDYQKVFAELGRVLKPGALSLHLFPGPWSPMEAHINVPLIPLCRYDWWLAVWAWMGRRSERQHGMAWREVLQTNRLNMQLNNYPSRQVLREAASACGLQISFEERAYIQCSDSRPNAMMKRFCAAGLGWAAAPLLQTFCQRLMVIWKISPAVAPHPHA